MKLPSNKTPFIIGFSLVVPLAQASVITTPEGLQFPMSPPVNDISDTFGAISADNRVTIQDGIDDTASNPSGSWDIDTASLAFDRINKTLWVGLEVVGADFGNSDQVELPSIGFGEFITGTLDLGVDALPDGTPELWFGIVPNGTQADFATAPYLLDGGGTPTGDTTTVNDYKANNLGLATGTPPIEPTSLGSTWISSDEDGGNSFGFLIDLSSNPVYSTLFPDTFDNQTYIFDFQIDVGSGTDTFGEDQVSGRLTVIPEPTSVPLLALLLGLSFATRRKR